MKESRNWIIIDVKTEKCIYGLEGVTMKFSTRDIAEEVAECLFKTDSDFILTQLKP